MMMTTRSSERAELIRIGKEKDKTLFSLRNFYIEETFSKTKQKECTAEGYVLVSRSQTKAWPQTCVLRHGWMDAPLFFCPQTSKDLLGWGFLWRIRTGLAGRSREEQEKELIVIEANLPGGARGRNETTATERRAGSMVRIRWAPGDRGEAPASSRFRTKVSVSPRETERERDGEGAKRPCGDAVRASRPSRDERTTSITSSFLADASLASRRALRRSRTTKIQTTRPI